MGTEEANQGSPEVIVFPAIPWLYDDTEYDAYLESSIAHLKAQEIPPNVKVLPVYLTPVLEDCEKLTKENVGTIMAVKHNEIIEAFKETDATHLWFLNADNEIPTDALKRSLEHDVDIVSGISVPQKTRRYTTAFRYRSAPTPKLLQSEPYFSPYRFDDLAGKTIGDRGMVATGHFCCLVKRRVFDSIRFRWPGIKVVRTKTLTCPSCGERIEEEFVCRGSKVGYELLWWMDVQMVGFSVRIDGNIVCGHLPNWPLAELVK